MKNKDFKSITNILEDNNPNKQFYDFQDFGECQAKIDQDLIPQEIIEPLPIRYFNKIIKFIKE